MHVRKVLAARLADRLDRLRDTFAALNTAVRDKVAEVVGKTAEDLVRHAVRAALDRSTLKPVYRTDAEDGWWDDDDNPTDRRRTYGEEEDSWSRPAPVRTPAPRPRLAAAFLAGCRAAGWWLSRSAAGRKPWVWAVAGLVAGVAVYAFPPLAAAVLPAAAA